MVEVVALGDVARFTNGGTPSRQHPEYYEGDIPWITGADIDGNQRVKARAFITSDAVARSNASVLPAGTVALVTRTSVGKVGVFDRPTAFSQDITAITPSEGLDVKYLTHFLRASVSEIARHSRGATIKGVTRAVVESLQLPLPTRDEQRRMADILDAADAIRSKRKAVLTLFDSLAQALFQKMFWHRIRAEETCFGDVIGLTAGRSLVADDPQALSDYRVIKISAVTSGTFKPQESKPLPPDYVPPASHLIRRGDLIMSRANTAELVGAVARVQFEPRGLALSDKTWRFDWRQPGDPVFYQALLSTPVMRARISRLSSGSGGSMKNVSKEKLAAMRIPLVPLPLQRAFAARIAHIDAQRAAVQRALAADDELFASLQSRTFSGKLSP